MTTISGRENIERARAIIIAHGLEFYAKTGMKVNRAYTSRNMIRAAKEITGQQFKARDYLGAAKALREFAK